MKIFTPLVVMATVAAAGYVVVSHRDTPTLVAASTPSNKQVVQEHVVRVIDGDTFRIEAAWNPYPALEWHVRVLGIDTPEKGYLAKCAREKALGVQATAKAKSLIAASGGNVTLTQMKHDKYGGRILASVMLQDGTTLEDDLLASGLAKRYNGSGPKPNWCS